MPHWNLNDISWQDFDAGKVSPHHLSLVRAACMVEHNGDDYARYLREVFSGDEEFQEATISWAEEEVQHGKALRKWAELADPDFNFDKSFTQFTDGYKLPEGAESVRGSRCGELIARCVVESGTSAYYTAIREASDEPVLQAICARIAADEYRHYQLFYRYLQHYQKQDKIGLFRRLMIAIRRVAESSDDELAYAFYSSQQHCAPGPYDRRVFADRYFACVGMLYKESHIRRMTMMILKAVGLNPQGFAGKLFNVISWKVFKWKVRGVV